MKFEPFNPEELFAPINSTPELASTGNIKVWHLLLAFVGGVVVHMILTRERGKVDREQRWRIFSTRNYRDDLVK